MVNKLIALAKTYDIDYAVDIYPFYGSDVEATLRAGHDFRHALIGPGVYASHGYERSHLDGAMNTVRLSQAYLEDMYIGMDPQASLKQFPGWYGPVTVLTPFLAEEDARA